MGLEKLLVYTKNYYKNPTVYITECGMGESDINEVAKGVNDAQRVDFYQRHIKALYPCLPKTKDRSHVLFWKRGEEKMRKIGIQNGKIRV
ncbi:hypothetical protein A4A49_56791 [Nicotiana attenuata]|uniref:Uncharacterized protein n=1 Tax=Nicotiana attenuata TaxID=49451 RepID=A0A1J6IDM0_NICAT|nr:hypothetical protein A4A49_56791 [Nicotiana attenuata]